MGKKIVVAVLAHSIDSHDMDSVSLHRVEQGKLRSELRKVAKQQDADIKFKLSLDKDQVYGDVFLGQSDFSSYVAKFFEKDLASVLKELKLTK